MKSGDGFVTIMMYQWGKVGKSRAMTLNLLRKGGVQMFFGRYDYTIDAKGRLNFPSKFREDMGESFVVLEWVDKCLFALPMSEVERLAEKLDGDDLMDSWEVSGDLFSTACEVVPDKQGRILLPAELREYAVLQKEVTIIGNRSHAEIWATDVWNARRAAITNEQRAERLRKLHL